MDRNTWPFHHRSAPAVRSYRMLAYWLGSDRGACLQEPPSIKSQSLGHARPRVVNFSLVAGSPLPDLVNSLCNCHCKKGMSSVKLCWDIRSAFRIGLCCDFLETFEIHRDCPTTTVSP